MTDVLRGRSPLRNARSPLRRASGRFTALAMSGSNFLSATMPAATGVLSFRFALDTITNLASNPWLLTTHAPVSIRLLASGRVRFGTSTTNDSTNPVPSISSGVSWIRCDITTGTGEIAHFYSSDGSSWTANGTATVAVPASTAAGTFQAPHPATRAVGRLRLVSMLDDGVEVMRFDPLLSGAAGYTDAYGIAWTVNGGGMV